MAAPETPVTAQNYAQHGLLFYNICDEDPTIIGDFEGLKSIYAIDADKARVPSQCGPSCKYSVVLNQEGVAMKVRPVARLEREVTVKNTVEVLIPKGGMEHLELSEIRPDEAAGVCNLGLNKLKTRCLP